jgi:hypothetical protein
MGTTYSDTVTNLVANPPVPNSVSVQGGRVRTVKSTIALGTGDIDDDDIIVMARVPSNAVIQSIRLFNDDLDAHTTPTLVADVGLYKPDGTVADRDCYASLITTLQSANTAGVELMFEARNINEVANKVWQDGDAVLTTDPGGLLDIAITIETVAATAAAGDVTMIVEYTVD